jgi:antitoxin component YwqK of YwqJK toxin-antitoxin module
MGIGIKEIRNCIGKIALFLLPAGLFAQIDTLNQEMVSMSATYQKPYEVGGVYYKKNEKTPFTGVLFGKYENGQYLSIQEYKNGIGNGTWVNYYENGQLKEIGTYRDNRVEGPIKQFYDNGKLKAEGTYAHWRKKVGLWKFYDRKGKLVRSETFK